MDANQLTWESLRSKGYTIDDFSLPGTRPATGRMLVVVGGVAMSFEDARALDLGSVTLDDMGQHRSAR